MGAAATLNPRELVNFIQSCGFEEVKNKGKGSHRVFVHHEFNKIAKECPEAHVPQLYTGNHMNPKEPVLIVSYDPARGIRHKLEAVAQHCKKMVDKYGNQEDREASPPRSEVRPCHRR